MTPADLPPKPAVVNTSQCGEKAGLYARLQTTAMESPTVAFACLPLLSNGEQRDRILRLALLSAAAREPRTAMALLHAAADRPWLGEINFFHAQTLADAVAAEAPADAEALLKASAARYPEVALREFDHYRVLPFSATVLATAALRAPDQAVSLAGRSESLRQAFNVSSRAELPILAALALRTDLDPEIRSRMALFSSALASKALTITQAASLSKQDGPYFHALADAWMAAPLDLAPMFERALAAHAQTVFRYFRDRSSVQSVSTRDLYFLMTFGRAEEDDALFGSLFDRQLLPRLKAQGRPLTKLLKDTRERRLRAFLSTAIAHRRLEPLLAVAKSEGRSDLLADAMTGIHSAFDPLDEAVAAAEIIENVPADSLPGIAHALQTNIESSTLYGLLAARVALRQRAAGLQLPPALAELEAQYGGLFPKISTLDTRALFSRSGVCLQRYFFYNDDDGVDSYLDFRQAYAHDPRWKVEEHAKWVRMTARSADGRTIEILANIPVDDPHDDESARLHTISEMIARSGMQPSVVVHRGHSFHLQKTLPFLNPGAQLVFLGSCRAMQSMAAVVQAAPNAQVIATREVGSMSVNDPLLKSINDALLKSPEAIEWSRFWKEQEAKLKGNPQFSGYLPPNQNGAALLLAAYFRYLTE